MRVGSAKSLLAGRWRRWVKLAWKFSPDVLAPNRMRHHYNIGWRDRDWPPIVFQMNAATLKLLTWATVATAIGSALLLAALGPDVTERVGSLGAQAAGALPRHSATLDRPHAHARPALGPH